MRTNRKRLAVLAAAALLAASPARAKWQDRSGSLPGGSNNTGKVIAIALVGGAALVGVILLVRATSKTVTPADAAAPAAGPAPTGAEGAPPAPAAPPGEEPPAPSPAPAEPPADQPLVKPGGAALLLSAGPALAALAPRCDPGAALERALRGDRPRAGAAEPAPPPEPPALLTISF